MHDNVIEPTGPSSYRAIYVGLPSSTKKGYGQVPGVEMAQLQSNQKHGSWSMIAWSANRAKGLKEELLCVCVATSCVYPYTVLALLSLIVVIGHALYVTPPSVSPGWPSSVCIDHSNGDDRAGAGESYCSIGRPAYVCPPTTTFLSVSVITSGGDDHCDLLLVYVV